MKGMFRRGCCSVVILAICLLRPTLAADYHRLAEEQAYTKSNARLQCRITLIEGNTISTGKPLKVQVEFSSPDARSWTLFNPWLNDITEQPGRLMVFNRDTKGPVEDFLRRRDSLSSRMPCHLDWVTLAGRSSLKREHTFYPADAGGSITRQIAPLPPGRYLVQFIANERLLFPTLPSGNASDPDFRRAWAQQIKIWDLLRSNTIEFTVEK
jgi:hypothetical protein